MLHPFVDRKANARFLALALGGMLCSVATLIHDSFLGVFMRDQLGMTNTVRSLSLFCACWPGAMSACRQRWPADA